MRLLKRFLLGRGAIGSSMGGEAGINKFANFMPVNGGLHVVRGDYIASLGRAEEAITG